MAREKSDFDPHITDPEIKLYEFTLRPYFDQEHVVAYVATWQNSEEHEKGMVWDPVGYFRVNSMRGVANVMQRVFDYQLQGHTEEELLASAEKVLKRMRRSIKRMQASGEMRAIRKMIKNANKD